MRTIAKLLALGNWESNEKNRSTPYCIAEEIVGSIAARFPLGHTPFFEELVVAQTVLAQHIACKLQSARPCWRQRQRPLPASWCSGRAWLQRSTPLHSDAVAGDVDVRR